MAFSGRVRTASGTATLAALVLVLAFGNPAYRDWATGHTNANSAWGWFLRLLSWPAWDWHARNDSSAALRDLLATDLKAILVIVFTAVLVKAMTSSLLASGRGTVGALLGGWGAYVFAAALAGFLSAFVTSNASVLTAFIAAAGGATYGLFSGWVVGLASTTGRR